MISSFAEVGSAAKGAPGLEKTIAEELRCTLTFPTVHCRTIPR